MNTSISIFPWFRANFESDGKNLIIESNNNFWIFPAGKNKEQIPIKDISSCSLHTYYDLPSILVGIILIIAAFVIQPLTLLSGWTAALIIVICTVSGVLFLFSGIAAKLVIEKKGIATEFYIPFYSRGTAGYISKWIFSLLDN